MISIEDIKKVIQQVPRRSVNYLLFCLSGVFIFVFGGIVPTYWNHVDLDQKINDEKRLIAENGTLQPLPRLLQSNPISSSRSLTVPPRVALQGSEIERIDALFRELAGRLGMKVISVVPDLGSSRDPHVLLMYVSLKGDFENFINVLKKLGELPYVDHIEEFAIQHTGNERALDITMQISLAVN